MKPIALIWVALITTLILAPLQGPTIYAGSDPGPYFPVASGASPKVPETSSDRPAGTAELIVEVEGLKSNKGRVALALFDDRGAFEQRRDPVRAEFVTARRKRCRWVVSGLPPGNYAVVAYHDRNNNGQLDRRKPWGIPSEPYGFSKDARGRFGPPAFEAARFEIPAGRAKIAIRLR